MSGLAGTVEVTNSSDNKAPWYQNNSIRRLFNGEDLDKETLGVLLAPYQLSVASYSPYHTASCLI